MDTRNGYRFKKKFDLQLDFKTYSEDGILFFISGADVCLIIKTIIIILNGKNGMTSSV